MPNVRLRTTGSFDNFQRFATRVAEGDLAARLDALGARGADALAAATPVDSGLTAESWAYRVVRQNGSVRIEWYNTNTNGDFNVAIAIQYGHGTGTGGYVQGVDYVNPAMKPVFEALKDEFIKEVSA
jgi:hypothetical protein